jgi:hypothetical protein
VTKEFEKEIKNEIANQNGSPFKLELNKKIKTDSLLKSFNSKEFSMEETMLNGSESETPFVSQDEKSLNRNKLSLRASPSALKRSAFKSTFNRSIDVDEIEILKHKNSKNPDKDKENDVPWILNQSRKTISPIHFDDMNVLNSKIEIKKLTMLISKLTKNIEKSDLKVKEEDRKDRIKKQW